MTAAGRLTSEKRSSSPKNQPALRRAPAGKGCSVCAKANDSRDRKIVLQRKENDGILSTLDVPPVVHDVLRSPGQPLDANTRAFFELRFGHDFSRVRVHTDDRAAESALAVNALAYTDGREMVFGAGLYRQGTSEGKRLIAHELTHVVQQSNPGSSGTTGALEAEAHAVGDHASAGHEVSIAGTARRGALQMDEASAEGEAIVTIAKENGRIAVVLVRNGKIVQGYAEIVPPPGVSAADAVNNHLVEAKTTETTARPKVDVILPSDWGPQAVNPAAKVQIKTQADVANEEREAARREKISELRELVREYFEDYEFQVERFGQPPVYDSVYGSPADSKSEDQIIDMLGDPNFFAWQQRRRIKRDLLDFSRTWGAIPDPEGIRNMWELWRKSQLMKELHDEKVRHDLKYDPDPEHALEQNDAAPTLLNWMANNPEPEVSGDEGKAMMYVLLLSDGNRVTLSESQYKKLRQLAKDKIETELKRIKTKKDRYQLQKNDRGDASKFLDAVFSADNEGKTWKEIDELTQAGLDALTKDDLKTSLACMVHADKMVGIAEKEYQHYEDKRNYGGEATLKGLEVVKVGSEIVLAVGTVPLGGEGLVIVTGEGITESLALAAARQAGGENVDLRDLGYDVSTQVVTAVALHGVSKVMALGPNNTIMKVIRESYAGQLGTDAVQSILVDSATYATKREYEQARGRGEKFTWKDFTNHFKGYLSNPSSLPLDVIKAQVLRHAGSQAGDLATEHGIPLKSSASNKAPSEHPSLSSPMPGEGAGEIVEPPAAGPEAQPLADEATPQRGAELPSSAEAEAAGKATPTPEVEQKSSMTVDISGSGQKGKPTAPRKNPDNAFPIPASNKSKASKGPAADEPVSVGVGLGGETPPVVTDLPDSTVISNLSSDDAAKVYENSIKEDPHREVGIWEDPKNRERVVVQGDFATVDTTSVLYSHPEFSDRQWKMIEHYHPGEDAMARIPSADDFGVITHWQREGAEPRGKVKSDVRYIDPKTHEAQTTEFGYDPDSPKPYYIEYAAEDGSRQRREFFDPPWAENSDFQRFVDVYTGAPSDRVPAAADVDTEPVTQPRPPVGSATPGVGGQEHASGPEVGGEEQEPVTLPKGATPGGTPPPNPASPVSWRVVRVNPNNPPDTIPTHTILEFPNGAQVWRMPDGRIAQKSMLAPSVGRAHAPGHEKKMFTQGEAGLVGPRQERAHSQGQGTGFESPYGILYAPREVNQILQNQGVEAYLRELRDTAPPAFGFRLRTETAAQTGTLRLKEITYGVDIVDPNGVSHPFFDFKINVTGTRTAPKVGIEPAEFSKNEFAEQMKNLVDIPAVMEKGLDPSQQPIPTQ